MSKLPDNIPPANQPDWDNASFDYFQWFKIHHLPTLEKYHTLLEQQYEGLPVGKGYDQMQLSNMLGYLDELIRLQDWLPDTEGGIETMDKVIRDRNQLEELYLNKATNDQSYWLAQEVKLKVFELYNYMSALCED